MHGAAHRAQLLIRAQWAVAPALLFLVVLGILYSSDAGPRPQPAAFTAIVLAPLSLWSRPVRCARHSGWRRIQPPAARPPRPDCSPGPAWVLIALTTFLASRLR